MAIDVVYTLVAIAKAIFVIGLKLVFFVPAALLFKLNWNDYSELCDHHKHELFSTASGAGYGFYNIFKNAPSCEPLTPIMVLGDFFWLGAKTAFVGIIAYITSKLMNWLYTSIWKPFYKKHVGK